MKASYNCIVTDPYKKIFKKYFFPCFDDSDVVLNGINGESFSSIVPNWRDNTFKRVIHFKLEKIIESLQEYEFVIWCDVDLFFCMPPHFIMKELENYLLNKDLIVSAERRSGGWINSGFFAAKSNDKTISFFKHLRDNIKKSNNTEQMVMQKLLHSNCADIKWSILPRNYWNLTVGFPFPKNLRIIHANWVSDRAGLGKIIGRTYVDKKDYALEILKNKFDDKYKKNTIKFL